MVLWLTPDYWERQVWVTSRDFLMRLTSVDGGNLIVYAYLLFLFEY